jgi:MFS family permease
MAVGAILWIPLTIGMGRRPVFLLASFVLFLATLGAGYVQTFEQLLVCVCFFGIAEGFALTAVRHLIHTHRNTILTTPQAFLVVIDMTFIDERPKGIALMWSVAGFFGTAFVALVPYIADHGKEWRAYYRYWSIPAMVSMALVFFLFPETYFKRPTVAFDGLIVLQSATEKTTVFKDIEVDSDIYRDLPELPQEQGIFGRYSIWRSPFSSWISMGRSFIQIAFCFINPLIFFMMIAISVNYAGMLFIGANYARILSDAPYNLPSRLLTLVNLSSAVGGLVAYPVGILPVQKIMDRFTKRNRGVREAEHYLIGFVLPVVTGAMSSLLFGMAVHYKCRLGAYYMAYGLNGFSWVTIAIITTIWVTEAFPRWAAPALAAMSGGAFLISFGMCFASAPWIAAHGFKLVGIELAVLQIVTGLVAVPIAFWGKSARQAIHGRWADERGGALRPL